MSWIEAIAAAPGLIALILVVVMYQKVRRLERMLEEVYVTVERKMPPE